MADTINRLIIEARSTLNKSFEKFDGMPMLLRFLIVLGLSTPLFVLACFIESVETSSILLLAAFLSPMFIASCLMLVKNKHSRLLYVFASILLGLSPLIAPSLKQFTANGAGSSMYELAFSMASSLAICLYLFLSKSVRNYFVIHSNN